MITIEKKQLTSQTKFSDTGSVGLTCFRHLAIDKVTNPTRGIARPGGRALAPLPTFFRTCRSSCLLTTKQKLY